MLPPWPSPLRHSHPCLSPTYTMSVFEGGFELLRPSVRPGHAFTHSTQRRTAAAGRRLTLCTYSQPWRGTARGLQSFGVCTATRVQLEGRNVPCKQCCASGLQQHLIICTKGVTAARLRLPNRVTLERVPTNWILCLRRRYAATATVTAAT